MPEHVHLLIGEPEKGILSTAIQSLKQGVARRSAARFKSRFSKHVSTISDLVDTTEGCGAGLCLSHRW